jgi:hypothetical protein
MQQGCWMWCVRPESMLGPRAGVERCAKEGTGAKIGQEWVQDLRVGS